MKDKAHNLQGTLHGIPENQIFLNINHLNDGTYVLKIIHKNKVIKETSFKKKK